MVGKDDASSTQARRLYAAAIACGALALLSVARWATSPEVVRRVTTPVLVGAAGAAALAAAAFVHRTGAGMGEVDSTLRWLWLAQCGCLAIVAAGVAAELIRARLLSHHIAGIVVGVLPSSEALRLSPGDTLALRERSSAYREPEDYGRHAADEAEIRRLSDF